MTLVLEMVRNFLPEQHPYPAIYTQIITLLNVLCAHKNWVYLYVLFELHLLQEVGFGLKLNACAVTNKKELLYGPTNEELITNIFKDYVNSYKDLPKNLYQIQWKFRDEIRPRFGIMRCREFLMKDNYSFDLTADAAKKSYDNINVCLPLKKKYRGRNSLTSN